jgi:succinyl-CoA synthetase beta subunit
MKLLEYQAKTLMDQFGIPIKKGLVIDGPFQGAAKIKEAGLSYPVVIKAQVQIGGRGKAGGVKFADTPEQVEELCGKMLGMDIRGFKAKELMIVEKADLEKEWYLSILLDRLSKSPLLIFSPLGGMDIEETARTNPGKIARVPLDPFRGVEDYAIEYAMDKTGADKQYKQALKDLVKKLFALFYKYCTMLVEINPLALDAFGNLIALDGKIEIDDNALPFLPDVTAWRDKLQEDPQVIEARKFNFHLVPMDASEDTPAREAGSIGVMSNGSGMLMSCIDLISKKGMHVGAALDLGGGATAERIAEAVRIMLERKNIDTVFICIFGGITRCDEVAKGAVLAMQKKAAELAASGKFSKNLILRIEGTNKEEAAKIIAASNLPIVIAEGIPNSVEAIVKIRGEHEHSY